MQEEYKRAFIAHKPNGFRLNFPNGNSLSTVWGVGTYSDNHDADFSRYDERFKEGSMTCEIMPDCSEKCKKKISKVCDLDSVAGYLTFEQWLKVVNI